MVRSLSESDGNGVRPSGTIDQVNGPIFGGGSWANAGTARGSRQRTSATRIRAITLYLSASGRRLTSKRLTQAFLQILDDDAARYVARAARREISISAFVQVGYRSTRERVAHTLGAPRCE